MTALCWFYLLLVTSASKSPGDVLSQGGNEYLVKDKTAIYTNNLKTLVNYAMGFQATADPASVEITYLNFDPSVSNDTFTSASFESYVAYSKRVNARAGQSTTRKNYDGFLGHVSYTYKWYHVFSWGSLANGVSLFINTAKAAIPGLWESPRVVCVQHRCGNKDQPCLNWVVHWPLLAEGNPGDFIGELCKEICRAQGMSLDLKVFEGLNVNYFCVPDKDSKACRGKV